MKHFKEAIVYLLVGIGLGSFISLLSFTLNHATPSMKQFGLLMTMSAIMGLLSLIFEYDKITFITQLISHFILEILTYGFFIWLRLEVQWLRLLIYQHLWLLMSLFLSILGNKAEIMRAVLMSNCKKISRKKVIQQINAMLNCFLYWLYIHGLIF